MQLLILQESCQSIPLCSCHQCIWYHLSCLPHLCHQLITGNSNNLGIVTRVWYYIIILHTKSNSGMSEEQLRLMEGSERQAIEVRLECLRNIQSLLDAAMMQITQYVTVVRSQGMPGYVLSICWYHQFHYCYCYILLLCVFWLEVSELFWHFSFVIPPPTFESTTKLTSSAETNTTSSTTTVPTHSASTSDTSVKQEDKTNEEVAETSGTTENGDNDNPDSPLGKFNRHQFSTPRC